MQVPFCLIYNHVCLDVLCHVQGYGATLENNIELNSFDRKNSQTFLGLLLYCISASLYTTGELGWKAESSIVVRVRKEPSMETLY